MAQGNAEFSLNLNSVRFISIRKLYDNSVVTEFVIMRGDRFTDHVRISKTSNGRRGNLGCSFYTDSVLTFHIFPLS